jgi:hypothetical protein
MIFRDEEKTTPAIVDWWNGASAIIDLSNRMGQHGSGNSWITWWQNMVLMVLN